MQKHIQTITADPRRNDGHNEYTHCAEPDCTAKVKNHRWGHTKADDWFFQKDGSAHCPEHTPEWVAGWRKRRDERKRTSG